MIDLAHRKARIIAIITNSVSLYPDLGVKNRHILIVGIINFIWNNWNEFWKNYWLCYLIGGVDVNRKRVIALRPNLSRDEALSLLCEANLYLRLNNTPSKIIKYFKLPTWGGDKEISNIALAFGVDSPFYPSILSHYSQVLKDFRLARNTLIHMTRESVGDLKTILSRYRIQNPFSPNNFFDSFEIEYNKRCINYLTDLLIGLLSNI